MKNKIYWLIILTPILLPWWAVLVLNIFVLAKTRSYFLFMLPFIFIDVLYSVGTDKFLFSRGIYTLLGFLLLIVFDFISKKTRYANR